MSEFLVNGKEYNYVVDYKSNDTLRQSFNRLTEQTYNFSFEKWYQSGYWDEGCILYSLLYEGEVVSHATVNVLDFMVKGELKKFVQLGTVMTNEDFRNQGLSRILMDKIMQDWEFKSDMIYLFANDSVLDFYPKFGFVPVDEYQLTKKKEDAGNRYFVRKMDVSNISDHELLERLTKTRFHISDLSLHDNIGIVMFYCKYFDLFSLGGNLYYLEDLDAIAVVEYNNDLLIIYDILASKEVIIDDVIKSLALEETQQVILRFTPTDPKGYELMLYKEEDLTLFVQDGKRDFFEKYKLIFPLLSHT